MITYNPDLISIQIVQLKSITTALGGSIQYIDEEKTTQDKEIYIREACPLSVCRAFQQRHKKISRYLIPVYTAIVKYDNRIICLERHPLGTFGTLHHEGFDGEITTWKPDCATNLEKIVKHTLTSDRDWLFDGRYIYSFDDIYIPNVLKAATNLTKDGCFKKIDVVSIDTQFLDLADQLDSQKRTCVAYVSPTGEYSISPPIWKDIMSVGKVAIKADEDANTGNFDKIDDLMLVNLNFALIAGKHIGTEFGFDAVDPLQLPRMMLDLHTVNLPSLPKQIKSTYDIGISYTHTLAWLLGILKQCNTLDTFIMMRSLLKYLTKKGIYRKDSFKFDNVFKVDADPSNIPLKSLDDLVGDNSYTINTLSNIINNAKKTQNKRLSNNLED